MHIKILRILATAIRAVRFGGCSFLIDDFLAFAGWFSLAELPRGLLNVDFDRNIFLKLSDHYYADSNILKTFGSD